MLWASLPPRPLPSQWPQDRFWTTRGKRAVLQGIEAQAPRRKRQAPRRKKKREFHAMSTNAVNVLLVGTNQLFRQGLRRLLDPEQFVVAAEARDLAALDDLLADGLIPDLVVADLHGCHDADLERLRCLRAGHDGLRVVVLANALCLADMARLLNAGADGYLVNELSAEALSLSLLLVMQGEKVLPSTLAGVLASDRAEAGNGALVQAQRNLTERETQILTCLLNGYSNKHIARALTISEGTVKVHLKSLMKKIAAANRTQAALWARNHGIGDSLGHFIAA
jgi:two-component system nitrate/nitrite response regulator NarL